MPVCTIEISLPAMVTRTKLVWSWRQRQSFVCTGKLLAEDFYTSRHDFKFIERTRNNHCTLIYLVAVPCIRRTFSERL